MEEITQTISQNLTGNTQTVMDAIAANISDEEKKLSQKAADVLSFPDPTEQEKQAFQRSDGESELGSRGGRRCIPAFCPCPILFWKS